MNPKTWFLLSCQSPETKQGAVRVTA